MGSFVPLFGSTKVMASSKYNKFSTCDYNKLKEKLKQINIDKRSMKDDFHTY